MGELYHTPCRIARKIPAEPCLPMVEMRGNGVFRLEKGIVHTRRRRDLVCDHLGIAVAVSYTFSETGDSPCQKHSRLGRVRGSAHPILLVFSLGALPPSAPGSGRAPSSCRTGAIVQIFRFYAAKQKHHPDGWCFCWRRRRDLVCDHLRFIVASLSEMRYASRAVAMLLESSLAFARFIRHWRRSQRSLSCRPGALVQIFRLIFAAKRKRTPNGVLFVGGEGEI